jgi:hypothetical protein
MTTCQKIGEWTLTAVCLPVVTLLYNLRALYLTRAAA